MKSFQGFAKSVKENKRLLYWTYGLGLVIILSVITLMPPLADRGSTGTQSNSSSKLTTGALALGKGKSSDESPGKSSSTDLGARSNSSLSQTANAVMQASSTAVQGSLPASTNFTTADPGLEPTVPQPVPSQPDNSLLCWQNKYLPVTGCRLICPEFIGGCSPCSPLPRMSQYACLLKQ